jgi:hypothetical protein
MDFTLPVLQRSGGVEIVPAAIVHGFVLSLLVPVLIALFSALPLSGDDIRRVDLYLRGGSRGQICAKSISL